MDPNLDLPTLDYLKLVMKIQNENERIESSTGYMILKSGLKLKINRYFIYFREEWMNYKEAIRKNNRKAIEEVLKRTTGGIISNGEIDINLSEIAAMLIEEKKEVGE